MEHNAAAVIAVVHVCVVLVAAVDSVEAAKIAFHQPSVAPCPDRKTSLVPCPRQVLEHTHIVRDRFGSVPTVSIHAFSRLCA